MSQTPAPLPPEDDELCRLTALVRDFSGLEFPDNRRQGLECAVDRALRAHDLAGTGELVRMLSDPARRVELEGFTASLTIGETHFFRNAPQLDALRTRVLPELIARRSEERRLRIWSAGCSTGEEAYSLAMMVDMLLPRRDGWTILIHATDINRDALDRAQRGVYGQWSFRQVPEGIQQRYFVRHDREFHLSAAIRDMVTFGYLNLVDDAYPSLLTNTRAMDLILCRNVLIYFNEDTINRVVGRLDECLVPGGWMVAGHAESPMPVFRKRFIARDFPMSVIYQKRGDGRGHRDAAASAPTPATAPAARQRPNVVPLRDADATRGEPATGDPWPRPERAATAARPAGDGATASEVARAQGMWRSGDVEGALRLLQALADREPADGAPLHLAATILASVMRLAPAEHTVRLALEREPVSAPIHYVHGLILQELGRRTEALEALRRCVYLDPAFALGHYSLASLLMAGGQRARALRALSTTIELVAPRPRDAHVEGGDGVTFGRLLELAEVQRALIETEGGS